MFVFKQVIFIYLMYVQRKNKIQFIELFLLFDIDATNLKIKRKDINYKKKQFIYLMLSLSLSLLIKAEAAAAAVDCFKNRYILYWDLFKIRYEIYVIQTIVIKKN